MELIISPPEIIISFDLSLSSMYPSGCFTPKSPLRYHPPLNAFSVAFKFFRYPHITVLPLHITSPMLLPSAGTLFIVRGSLTSSSSIPTWSIP
uniref:Uncharacterized protein n=1 Tax=Cajanus cajan TaxID=3821 RepID=A0A151SCW4_CAJCA|nr:hypothetical protein KK1_025393 [Cajanus cajan]